MNLSSLFNNKQALVLFSSLLAVIIYGLITANFILSAVVVILLIIALFLPSTTVPTAHVAVQESMQRVLKNASLGQLEDRVTNIPDDGSALSARAWHINDMLDQLEAFMRDAVTSIQHASSGKTYSYLCYLPRPKS